MDAPPFDLGASFLEACHCMVILHLALPLGSLDPYPRQGNLRWAYYHNQVAGDNLSVR